MSLPDHAAADIGSAILRDTPPPLARVRPGLPPDVERIVGRCPAKGARERFQTALDVATVLDGSVRKAGNPIRIGVHLVDETDSSHLWSET